MAISEERLKELEELCSKASPGPWRWGPFALYDDNDKRIVDDGSMDGETDAVIDVSGHDALFIAASRTALPELIAEVRRCHKRLKQWEDEDVHEAMSCYLDHEKLKKVGPLLEALEKILNNSVPGGHDQVIAREALEEWNEQRKA